MASTTIQTPEPKSSRWLYLIAALLILALVIFIWWSESQHVETIFAWPSKSRRVETIVQNMGKLRNPQITWLGKTVIVSGEIGDAAEYQALSQQLSQIVGLGHVVNRVTVDRQDDWYKAGETLGILTIPVHSRYDDSPESLRQISSLIRLPDQETITVLRNETLSEVILKHYRFGHSDLPHSYALLAQRIVTLNKIDNQNQIHSGPLRIPILPPRALISSSSAARPGFSYYRPMKRFAISRILAPSLRQAAVLSRGGNKSFDATSFVSIPVTPETLGQTQEVLPDFATYLTSARIRVALADGVNSTGGAIHKTLNAQEASILQAAVKKKSARNVYVFVLDDGWPDSAAYSSSLADLQQISNIVRDKYGLGHVNIRTHDYIPLPLSSHSGSIRDALREFTDIDTSNMVRVIYVPLSKAQNSADVLTELLTLNFIVRHTKSNPSSASNLIDIAKQNASDVLEGIGDTFDDQRIDTDESVIQAIWALADIAVRDSPNDDVFFINESWTIKWSRLTGSLDDGHSGISTGIAVAATGDTPSLEVNREIGGLDFARQATSSKSVLAVMNVIPSTGLICNSSIVRQDLFDQTFVAAYDGEVIAGPDERHCLDGTRVDTCVCGTSFSAPRLAWLLALSEAERTGHQDSANWNAYMYGRVLKMRTSDSVPFRGTYLHLGDLLKP